MLGLTSCLICVGSPQSAEFLNSASYLYGNEMCPIYASMPSSTSEDIYAPNIMLSNSLGITISPNAKISSENYQKYLSSFEENVEKNEVLSRAFKAITNRLCQIPVREVLVQYNDADESLDFQMVLLDGVEVSVSQFVKETDKLVDFTISHDSRMLVCGEITIDDFMIRIGEVLNG